MSEPSSSGGERLARLMAHRGVASRREAEEMITDGRVRVNGQVVTAPCLVDPAVDEIRVDGKPLPSEPPKVYYLYYKPKGVLTTRDDPEGRPTVFDVVDDLPFRVEPVGRLDFDTEGALILTNDGDLAHKLTHPSGEVPKRYLVKVWKRPSDEKLDAIRRGRVYLDDGPTLPAKVRVLEQTEAGNCWIEVTVTEGRNRLIRRMFQQLRHPVAKLRRESFATVSLRGLERGMVRPLTDAEVRRLRAIASGETPARAGRVERKPGFAKAKPKIRPQAKVKRTKQQKALRAKAPQGALVPKGASKLLPRAKLAAKRTGSAGEAE